MYVSIISVRGIVAEIRQRGLPIDGLLACAGLDESGLADTRATLPIDAFERLVQYALKLTDCPSLGLSVGGVVPEFQLMSHFAQALPTLREAIAMFERYMPIFVEGVYMNLREEGDLATLEYGFKRGPDPIVERFCTELCSALCTQVVARYFTAGKGPRAVHFRHAQPPYVEHYERVFGCPARFEADECAIVFEASALDRVQPNADAFMVDLLRGACEKMLAAVERPLTQTERIRLLLRDTEDLGNVTVESVAAELRMAPRMLRRLLTREGTSLSALIDQTRIELAAEQLSQPGVSIKEVAARLGYSDVSAFHRAFKRAIGVTPGEYARDKGSAQARSYPPPKYN